MTRFRLDHPIRVGVHAEAGVDHAVGPFFVDLFREGRDRPFKTLDFFTHGRPVTLMDCFAFLIAEGFATRTQVEAALMHLQHGGPKPRSKGVMRVVEIVMELKRSAD